MGFTDIVSTPKVRRSWRSYKSVKLNSLKYTSLFKLRQMKKDLIRTGKIDVGIPIVPIDYTTMKINKQGKLVG